MASKIQSVLLENGIEFNGILIEKVKGYSYYLVLDKIGRLEEYVLVKSDYIVCTKNCEDVLSELYSINLEEKTFNPFSIEEVELLNDPLMDIIHYCIKKGEVINYLYENKEDFGIISGFLLNFLNIEKINSKSVNFIGSVRIVTDGIKYIRFNGPKYYLLKKSYERKIQLS